MGPLKSFTSIRVRANRRDFVVELIILVLFGAPLIVIPLLFFYWTVCNLLMVIGITDGCWLSSYRY